jgi:diguanylate cyclase (GGDEF)-like protein/PAS domain S-box-containing protein
MARNLFPLQYLRRGGRFGLQRLRTESVNAILLMTSVVLAAYGGWLAATLIARRRRAAASQATQGSDQTLMGLEQVVETMQLGVTITDTGGRILYSNPADAKMHGYTVAELIGQEVRIFAPGGAIKPLGREDLARMRSWRRETTNVRKDGSAFPCHLMSDVVRDHQGEILGVVTTCEDITQRKAGEAALRESEERYALAASGAADGIWDWDLRSDVLFTSPRWRATLGLEAVEMGHASEEWFRRVHPDDLARVKVELSTHLQARTPHLESEHRLLHKDGAYRWVLARGLAVRDAQGKAYRLAGSLTDITERKEAEEQLIHDALHDPLSGLPNRAFFITLLDRAIKRTRRRNDYLFAVLFVDLDRFKLVNDSLGHGVGDQLLVAISQRLKSCLRPGDVVARLGGDEFTILLEDIGDMSDATRVAERIQTELKEAFVFEGHEVFTSASIGIALSTAGHERPEYFLRDADTAMYRAKARGKARYEMFDEAMHTRAVAQLKLETDLRRALEREELRVLYQPIVVLDSGQITGFEALVRWQHSERGLIPPKEFIPMAEETGLILPIGRWVMETACHQTRVWLEQFPDQPQLSISVNMSAKHFQQPDLVAQVLEVLKQAGLSARNLRLEITESMLMDEPDAHVAIIRDLRGAGIQVQIDDFGTGYSSLSYLQRFSVDTLKIDRSFLAAGGDGESWDIVETIITLAEDLGVNVIAEGVETEEQTERLKQLRCAHAQGFLFREPVDADSATALLAAQHKRRRSPTTRA